MADETVPTPPVHQTVSDGLAAAPIIYFEEATNSGHLNGIINVTLAARRALPDGKGGVQTDLIAAAYLRGNIPAMLALKAAIDTALLLAAPTEGKAN